MSAGRRVLQVVGSLNVGGAENMVVAATHELVRMGFVVDFLVFGEQVGALEPQVTDLGCRVLRTDAPATIGRMRFVGSLAEMLRREGPFDVVHSHVNFASGLVLTAAARAGVPVRVAHSHSASDPSRGMKAKLYSAGSRGLIFKHSTVLAACGNDAGQHMFGDRWRRQGVVIRNGVVLEPLLEGRGFSHDVRRELGLSPDTLLLGSIGRIVESKNHAFLLTMMEEGRHEDVHLVVVGEGPLRHELESRVGRAGLSGRVSFLGLRRDVPRILSALDFVVMPSYFEGLPLTLVEAQAAGTPALVSSSVTNEVDLGLGLIQFLPIDDPGLWEQAIHRSPPPRVDDAEIRRRFESTGYDSVSTARRLAELYRVG
jgi:glycosyltransferase EpsF